MKTADNVVCGAYSHRVKLSMPPLYYPPVLLEPGEYTLGYASHRVEKQFNRGSLAVYFALVDELPDEIVVARYYPVILGKGRKGFAAKRNGALVSEYRRLFPRRRLTRTDQIPMSWLADQFIVGRIGTVTRNYAGDEYDERQQYSVVQELVRCV